MKEYRNAVRAIKAVITRNRRMIGAIAVSGLLSGCGLLQKVGILPKPPEPPPAVEAPVPLAEQPYELKLSLEATEAVNPDSQSRPSPIQVRIFLTDGASEIASKTFEEVFDMGGNVIEPRPLATVTLRPGQVKELTLPANKTQTLLAIAAAYRDPYQSIWMASAVVTPQDTVSAAASLSAQRVTIQPSR